MGLRVVLMALAAIAAVGVIAGVVVYFVVRARRVE